MESSDERALKIARQYILDELNDYKRRTMGGIEPFFPSFTEHPKYQSIKYKGQNLYGESREAQLMREQLLRDSLGELVEEGLVVKTVRTWYSLAEK